MLARFGEVRLLAKPVMLMISPHIPPNEYYSRLVRPQSRQASTNESQGMPATGAGAALVIIQGDHIAHLEAFGVADASGRAVTPQNAFGSLSLGRGAFWQICEFQQGCPPCGMSLRVYEFC
jgi:hypothetical protein